MKWEKKLKWVPEISREYYSRKYKSNSTILNYLESSSSLTLFLSNGAVDHVNETIVHWTRKFLEKKKEVSIECIEYQFAASIIG